MVAGFGKYCQIARRMRDEDLRADRQPEFTQLDIEMSFVEQEDILQLIEQLMIAMIAEVTPHKRVISPFPRMTYREAIERYGSDKPDLRYGMELIDVGAVVHESQFGVFTEALARGGQVKGIRVPGCGGYTRKQLDELSDIARIGGAKGAAWVVVEADGAVRSSFTKFFTPEQMQALVTHVGGERGDLLIFVADTRSVVAASLDKLRREFGRRLKLGDPNLLAFGWIVDFPMFEWNPETQHWDAQHHPFCMTNPEDVDKLETHPGEVRAAAYDLVCNGYELASGSIRIHDRAIQQRIFELLDYEPDEIYRRFGHMLDAFEYGAPPHGGIAPGVDRIMALLCDEENIREVIAFPKTQRAEDLMMHSPSPVDERQLHELHLALLRDE